MKDESANGFQVGIADIPLNAEFDQDDETKIFRIEGIERIALWCALLIVLFPVGIVFLIVCIFYRRLWIMVNYRKTSSNYTHVLVHGTRKRVFACQVYHRAGETIFKYRETTYILKRGGFERAGIDLKDSMAQLKSAHNEGLKPDEIKTR